jgi:hypothetical protein
MGTVERARELLLLSGEVRPQLPTDWSGPFPVPPVVEQFYRDVGPVDVCVGSYGNSFFLPSLARLWEFQAGYRWNGLSGEPITDWQDDWLVVADEGGDPFILSHTYGTVLHAKHGMGEWDPGELFPDLVTMAACLGQLGAVVLEAGERFTDEDCRIRPEWRDAAVAGLRQLLGSPSAAENVLETLGWG